MNIFNNIISNNNSEITDILFEDDNVRIERIISNGQITPPALTYDQKENEWVSVVEGSAAILFTNENREVLLQKGDNIMIYASEKHRVTYTSSPCIWLCVFEKQRKSGE